MVHSTQQTDQGARLQDPDADLIAALRASELAATGGWEAGSGDSAGMDVADRAADASMTADERERVFMIRKQGLGPDRGCRGAVAAFKWRKYRAGVERPYGR